MNYYSDYEEEPKDGNSESKWEPTLDMNIIKSVMSAATAILPKKEDIGQVLNASFSKQGDGPNMSAKMVISTHLWTIVWENTDLVSSKASSFCLIPTEENKETEKLRSLSISAGALAKLFGEDGAI